MERTNPVRLVDRTGLYRTIIHTTQQPQQLPHRRRLFHCIILLTFVWTTIWIVSFHRSYFLVKYYHYFYENTDNVSLLPPLIPTSWNLFEHHLDFGDDGATVTTVSSTTTSSRTPYYYITDTFCSGCRHSIADPSHPNSERCGYYIYQQYQKTRWLHTEIESNNNNNNSDVIISMIGDMIAQQFPKGCSKCQRKHQPNRNNSILSKDDSGAYQNDICTKDQYQYWRYDSVAPVIRASSVQDQWFSTSKPKQHHFTTSTVIASETTPDSTITREQGTYNNYYGTNIPMKPNTLEYFMEYNPSIVILPKNQYKFLQFQSMKHNYYVISFRVSNQNYCFHPNDQERRYAMMRQQQQSKTWNTTNDPMVSSVVGKDYLGIIIVNVSSSDFPNGKNIQHDKVDIVHDTVVDLKAIHGFQGAQDFRLFVLQKQLYISSFDTITPLWLSTTSRPNVPTYTRKDMKLVPTAFVVNVSDHPKIIQMNVWVRKSLSCVNCHRKRGLCGKNFNYFVDDNDMTVGSINNHTAAVFVELWPTGPHTVHTVDLHQPCQRELEPNSRYIGHIPEVQPTFPTLEEVDFPTLRGMESIFTRGRGSACCISLRYPNNVDVGGHNNQTRTILVGIQHTKTPSQRNKILPPNVTSNHYLSSFYAFESKPPYNIIAQTGWFCLGFPDDPQNNDQPTSIPLLHRITAWRKLVLGGRSYNCPRIHFVSGITIKVNDPSSVILAYGINDCYSRFVEIQLSDIYHMLFVGPSV